MIREFVDNFRRIAPRIEKADAAILNISILFRWRTEKSQSTLVLTHKVCVD